MRLCLALVLMAGCSFDGGVPFELVDSIDGGRADDAATSTDDDAAVDAAPPGTPDAGEPDAEVPLVTYDLQPMGAANVVANFGGGGGGNFDELCPDGRVLTGMDGDNTSNGVCRFQGICSLLTANPDGTVVTSDPVVGPLHGSSGSFVAENPLNCPANSVVVAANGRDDGIVRQFRISCAPLTWDYGAGVYTVGATTQVPGNIGSNTGDASAGACGAGEVSGGWGGNAGTLIDRFELHCFSLQAVAQ